MILNIEMYFTVIVFMEPVHYKIPWGEVPGSPNPLHMKPYMMPYIMFLLCSSIFDVVEKTFWHERVFIQVHQVGGLGGENEMCRVIG